MPDSAAVIAVANSKGGCGKSSTCVILAGEYASQGYRVHLIDADPKKRLLKWAAAGVKPAAITASEADGKTMRQEIEKARAGAEVVLIDIEGSVNAALTMAVAYADAVIIPATINPLDTEDGLGTAQLVADMAHASNRKIPYAFVWSCVPSAIRSREMTNCEAQVAAAGIPVLAHMMQRSAFSSLFSFQTTLDELPASEVSGIDKAKSDAIKLVEAVAALMASSSQPTTAIEAAE